MRSTNCLSAWCDSSRPQNGRLIVDPSDSGRHAKHRSPSLVRSQLFYCSQIWRPCLIQDILLLERVQRRATKYILNDYTSSYRARLLKLSMLPLMYIFELNDLLFFIKSIKNPSPHFDITKWIHLSIGVTRSSSHLKLAHKYIKYNSSCHFYFNRLPVYGTLFRQLT